MEFMKHEIFGIVDRKYDDFKNRQGSNRKGKKVEVPRLFCLVFQTAPPEIYLLQD